MVSERQKIEAPLTPAAETYKAQPPPSYDEVNGMFASSSVNDSVTSVDFFLGETLDSFESELNLSVGDTVIVRKTIYDSKSIIESRVVLWSLGIELLCSIHHASRLSADPLAGTTMVLFSDLVP
ncbi:hypothetical protein GUJ93_ZPchr0004g38301 [Zizania palustris]|uniref:Uncharacterized protein n=1 Tax=Zizania palustris TaxID=103762 RepID=A0A8J5VP03_ZIZPA|nr:hypothetical protein GUJ93_ZPchr0004g38301 [Zizania palustris]